MRHGAGDALADAAAGPCPAEQAVGTTPRAAGVDWPGPDSPCKGAAQAATSPLLSARRLCFAGGASSEHADAAGPGRPSTRASSSDKAATTLGCADAAPAWCKYQLCIRFSSGPARCWSLALKPGPLRALRAVKWATAHRRCSATSARKSASVFLGGMLARGDVQARRGRAKTAEGPRGMAMTLYSC